MVIAPEQLPHMSADELRDVVQSLLKTVTFKQATIDKLTHENAYLKRLKFAAQSERFSAEQRSLLEETLDEDLQAVNDEIEALSATDAPAPRVKAQPKRQPLPANLPRVEVQHEPDSTTCACGCQMKRIGEDVAEKLDYQPGVFSVERHVRGKWACAKCQTLIQAPMDAHIIDKGIPTTGLLAQVLVAKFADHLPLYRQEAIFGRSGVAIPRSTLGAWVGTEVGCLAHARRKFFDLHASNKSQIAHSALEQIARVYDIEREIKELDPDERRLMRQEKSKPLLDALHQWMILNRQKVPDGSATAKALDYSLRRWSALTRFVGDGQLPVDNNHIENQIRPIAIGRNNWLFAGSLRAGKRAAAVMSLIQSARLNGHDPYAYLKDVLTRLPTQRNSQIADLLPHRWQAQA